MLTMVYGTFTSLIIILNTYLKRRVDKKREYYSLMYTGFLMFYFFTPKIVGRMYSYV